MCWDQEKSLSVGHVLHWLLWNGRVELDIMKPSMSGKSDRIIRSPILDYLVITYLQ